MKPYYLVVTPFFPCPGRHFGGYCYDFARALQRTERYEVRVFVPGGGADYDYQGVHVCRFPIRILPSSTLPFLFSGYNVRSFLWKLKAEGISPGDVAVCHGHTAFYGIYPLAVKRLNPSCLTLLHHHDLASFGLNLGILRHLWLYRLIQFFALRKIHNAIDGHVFISHAVERSFTRFPDTSASPFAEYRMQGKGLTWLKPVKVKASLILHNGVNVHDFRPMPDVRRANTFVIGCVANVKEGKGHLALLRAVEILRDRYDVSCQLRMLGTVGDAWLIKACEDFVREHGLESQVVFERERSHEQLCRFYNELNLLVVPSYFEGFGCVFTEAWACGTPFITCEGQGMDDMILPEERKLWLCKPMNPDDLAEKILYYYKHRPEQHMAGPVDIDVLVPRFVEQVEALRAKLCRWANHFTRVPLGIRR